MKIIKINSVTLIFLLIAYMSGFIKDALIIFLIILIHEFGHVFFSYLFNRKIISITIYPFGGITKTENLINSNEYSDLIIFFGGIIFQILLYLIMYLLFKIGFIRLYIFSLFIKYNTSILLFNLIPIIPLDGYLILNYFFNIYLNFRNSYFLSLFISLIATFFYLLINYFCNINNYFIVLLFIVKMYEYIINYKYIYEKFLLERYLYNFSFKKNEMVKKNSLDFLFKNRKHYFFLNNIWISEDVLLKKKFDK